MAVLMHSWLLEGGKGEIDRQEGERVGAEGGIEHKKEMEERSAAS